MIDMTALDQYRATLAQASELLDKAQRLLTAVTALYGGLRREGYL